MNRRITNTMAKDASILMKKKAFNQKIENVTAELNTEIENLVRKYIPAPIIACVNEYPTYFHYTIGASITTNVEGSNGWSTRASYIKGELSFRIPDGGNYVCVENKEYEVLKKIDDKRKRLEKQRDEFGEQVYNALIALRTEKAIEKELPEALKYIEFPKVIAVPMHIYTGLREIIGKIV